MGPSRPPVKPRRYDASRRREQAQLAREAILDAAQRRFLVAGFSATTVASIAADAQVSPGTIYQSFSGKPGLVRALCERALAGEGPIPADECSDQVQAMSGDAASLLHGLGTRTTEAAPRIAPLLLLLATAAENDAEIARLRRELDDGRLRRMTHLARTLASKTHLRAGITVEAAGEIMWTYSSPELYRLLVLGRGWTPEQYGKFIGEALIAALLDSSGRNRTAAAVSSPSPPRAGEGCSGPPPAGE